MEYKIKWSEAGEACDFMFRFGLDCCSFTDDVGGEENFLHNWNDVVPYVVVTSHFRDPSTGECVLCKCINGLITETGGESLGIEKFKMELELDLNHEDVIWCAMRFVTAGHAYERIGSGGVKDFIEFFAEGWRDYCVEGTLLFNTCSLLDSVAGAFEGAFLEEIIQGVGAEGWGANLRDVWE